MMLERNLLPGQWQIGNFVFGAGTMFTVEECDVGPYEVNVQDYQQTQSDEQYFGMDTLKPMPMTLTINALHNYALKNVVGLIPYTQVGMKEREWPIPEMNFENDRRPGLFAKEWRFDEGRHQWGELKPLKFCRPVDGTVVRIYGRPGKLSVVPLGLPPNNQVQQLVAEYRRSDTLYYSDFEWLVHARPNEVMTIVRAQDNDMGDAPSWLRLILVGPMTRPIIQLGFTTIELDVMIPAGAMAEISSYPWQRRAIDLSNGVSLNSRIISPYLDKLLFETDSSVEFSWNASGLSLGGVDEVDFGTYSDVSMLHNDWNIDYLGPGDGSISVKVIALPAIGIFFPAVVWQDGPLGFKLGQWRLGTMIRKGRKTISDWQKVGFRMGSPAETTLIEEQPTNRIIGRANESRTRYSYWEISYTRVWFGVHIDGTDYNIGWSNRQTIPRLLARIENWIDNFKGAFGQGQHGGPGWEYEAEFGSGENLHTHTLWINKHRVAVFHDSAAIGFVGKEYRGYGAGFKATQRLLGQSTPGPLLRFWARDNYPPTFNEKDVLDEMEAEYGTQLSTVWLFWRDAWHTI